MMELAKCCHAAAARTGFLTSARTAILAVTLVVSGCSTNGFTPQNLSTAGFLERAVTQSSEDVVVSAALLDAEESEALIGIDLYDQGVQPVWVEISNSSAIPLRASLWSIDRNYFSPIEVAYRNKGRFSSQGYQDLERWLHNSALSRHIPPKETRSGLVFTSLRPGTKGFNLDLISRGGLQSFTFFLALPGFEPDYSGVDFSSLYNSDDVASFDESEFLGHAADQMSCCATDKSGTLSGGPLNILFVGSPKALRRSFMRGGWTETSKDTRKRMVDKQHQFRGRVPDGRFYLDRADGEERVLMNVWLAPWQVDGQATWVAQAYYRHSDLPVFEFLRENEQFQASELLAKFVGESISADIDSAQRFIVQNLWYNQSIRRLGFVPGIAPKTMVDPGETFDGFGYFTKGSRAVIYLSDTPVSMSATELIPAGDTSANNSTEGE